MRLYGTRPWPVRTEVDEVHRAWLAHVAAPGTWWSGAQRVAFVQALWAALDDPSPRPPWDPPPPPAHSALPAAGHAMAHRLARHAATTTAAWFERTADALGQGAPAFVELAALAATGCAVAAFGPALGLPRPALPDPEVGEPARVCPPLVEAAMNWVPVAAPADEVPAVVQAFTSVPAEHAVLWRFAAAQYMPVEEMGELDWRRAGSPLHRQQLELVASRLSVVRECFY